MGTLPILLGLIASACIIGSGLPQAVKIWRSRSAAGVSIPMWVLFYGVVCLWLGYGLRIGNVTLDIANLGTMATSIVVLLAIVRSRGTRVWLAVAGIVLMTGLTVFFALAVPIPVLAVIFLAATFLSWLQATKSFQTWRAHGPSTVSIPTFALRACGASAWILQSLFTGDRIILSVTTVGLTASATTIVIELSIKRRAKRAVMCAA